MFPKFAILLLVPWPHMTHGDNSRLQIYKQGTVLRAWEVPSNIAQRHHYDCRRCPTVGWEVAVMLPPSLWRPAPRSASSQEVEGDWAKHGSRVVEPNGPSKGPSGTSEGFVTQFDFSLGLEI